MYIEKVFIEKPTLILHICLNTFFISLHMYLEESWAILHKRTVQQKQTDNKKTRTIMAISNAANTFLLKIGELKYYFKSKSRFFYKNVVQNARYLEA